MGTAILSNHSEIDLAKNWIKKIFVNNSKNLIIQKYFIKYCIQKNICKIYKECKKNNNNPACPSLSSRNRLLPVSVKSLSDSPQLKISPSIKFIHPILHSESASGFQVNYGKE